MLIARRQRKPLLHRAIDLAADVQETGPGVQHLAQPGPLADAQPGRPGQRLVAEGQGALSGVDAAGDRQGMREDCLLPVACFALSSNML